MLKIEFAYLILIQINKAPKIHAKINVKFQMIGNKLELNKILMQMHYSKLLVTLFRLFVKGQRFVCAPVACKQLREL